MAKKKRPRRPPKRRPTPQPQRSPEPEQYLHVKRGIVGTNYYENLVITNSGGGIQFGGDTPDVGPDTPDISFHGDYGYVMLDAESRSPKMLGGGSIEHLDGKLVHRPSTKGSIGYSKTVPGNDCPGCGFAAYKWSDKCPRCG